jgi:hypothetical protein
MKSSQRSWCATCDNRHMSLRYEPCVSCDFTETLDDTEAPTNYARAGRATDPTSEVVSVATLMTAALEMVSSWSVLYPGLVLTTANALCAYLRVVAGPDIADEFAEKAAAIICAGGAA